MKSAYNMYAVAALFTFSSLAVGHGTLVSPMSRVYRVYLSNPENPDFALAQAAVDMDGSQSYYNWNELSRNIPEAVQAGLPPGFSYEPWLPNGHHVLFVAWQRDDPVGEVFFSASNLLVEGMPCGGDVNGDGIVTVADLFVVLDGWGTNGAGADIAPPLNVVDVADVLVIIAAWGPIDISIGATASRATSAASSLFEQFSSRINNGLG
jgi:predicted carbohydrate-binding protein with CBM5 and CBM33 domain